MPEVHSPLSATSVRVVLPLLLALGLAASAAADDETCLACHDAADPPAVGLGVDPDTWASSIHAELGLGCADCHAGKEDYPHEPGAPSSCGECHIEAAEAFAVSVHADNRRRNGDASAWPEGEPCGACHGVHDVRAVDDPLSRVHHANVPATCGGCHGDIAIVQANGLSTAPFENYQQSVHGLVAGDPDVDAAVCTSCHDAHRVLRGNHPESPINPFRIAETCGQCHATESEEYTSSVHGTAFAKGVSTAPTCTGCHGIHTIKMVPEQGATPLEQRLVRSTCVACHASEALMSEFGVAPERVRTYQATYHGLALKRGTAAVADCASCHGIHAIYPSSDPRSTVAPQNLEATCGHCHPGAGEEFTKSPVHFALDGEPSPDVVITTWVKRIYWALLIGVLGGMLLHNAVILGFYVRRKARRERAVPAVRRFSTSQTVQHGVLAVTFIALTVTGFALAYPDMWWSRLLEVLGLDEALRRGIHRVAAVALTGAALYHLWWLLGTAYGRQELGRIWPRWRDLRELGRNLGFHLGRADRPPAAEKYDYPAKLEYWAVVWGTAVMAITGVVLWFPVWATSFLPYWSVKVSEVIHLFEAWLATLAILFFHFFYVIGHPEVYPMSLSMFTGRMPEEEARRHHPAWLLATAGAGDEPPGDDDSPEDPK